MLGVKYMGNDFRNIYLVGSKGYIGQRLYTKLKEKYTVKSLDLTGDYNLDLNVPELFDYQLFANDFVIVTAAISSPDICEKERERAYRINVLGTEYLIKEALRRGCRVLFFSSDAVYGFNKRIVDERTETVADTAYGSMKKEIEDKFVKYCNFKSIRLSYVFSIFDKYTTYLLKCAKEGKKAEVFHPFYRNVVSLDMVMDSVEWLVNNWETFDSTFLNICGKELVSRLRIADEIIRCTNLELSYEVKEPGEDFYKNRPSILEMHSLYIDKIINSPETFSEIVKKQFTGGKI